MAKTPAINPASVVTSATKQPYIVLQTPKGKTRAVEMHIFNAEEHWLNWANKHLGAIVKDTWVLGTTVSATDPNGDRWDVEKDGPEFVDHRRGSLEYLQRFGVQKGAQGAAMIRTVGRVDNGLRFEIARTSKGSRGFESLTVLKERR